MEKRERRLWRGQQTKSKKRDEKSRKRDPGGDGRSGVEWSEDWVRVGLRGRAGCGGTEQEGGMGVDEVCGKKAGLEEKKKNVVEKKREKEIKIEMIERERERESRRREEEE